MQVILVGKPPKQSGPSISDYFRSNGLQVVTADSLEKALVSSNSSRDVLVLFVYRNGEFSLSTDFVRKFRNVIWVLCESGINPPPTEGVTTTYAKQPMQLYYTLKNA